MDMTLQQGIGLARTKASGRIEKNSNVYKIKWQEKNCRQNALWLIIETAALAAWRKASNGVACKMSHDKHINLFTLRATAKSVWMVSGRLRRGGKFYFTFFFFVIWWLSVRWQRPKESIRLLFYFFFFFRRSAHLIYDLIELNYPRQVAIFFLISSFSPQFRNWNLIKRARIFEHLSKAIKLNEIMSPAARATTNDVQNEW